MTSDLTVPNDVTIDPEGGVYVSDPHYVGNEPRALGSKGCF